MTSKSNGLYSSGRFKLTSNTGKHAQRTMSIMSIMQSNARVRNEIETFGGGANGIRTIVAFEVAIKDDRVVRSVRGCPRTGGIRETDAVTNVRLNVIHRSR